MPSLTVFNIINLTTTPKKGGIKGDPKRVILFKKLELLDTFVLLLLPFHVSAHLFFVEAYRAYTVSFRPKMSSPVPFLQLKMSVEYFDGTLSFQKSNALGYWKFRRNRDNHIHMVFLDIISKISNFFHSHNCLKMSSTDCCKVPFRILNRYLGHQIKWYLHCHTACANLLNSLIEYLLVPFFGPPSRRIRRYSILVTTNLPA